MIRAFVAIRPPQDITAALLVAQAGLPVGRAVEREILHLTLAFLGERPEPEVEDAHYALDAIRGPAFTLTLAGLGLFEHGRGRVVYAGVRPEPSLSWLRDKVVQAARGAGIPLERGRYRPHVTLARVNGMLWPDEAERLRAFVVRGADWRAGPFPVRAFALMRSRLGRGGPSHEELATYRLADG